MPHSKMPDHEGKPTDYVAIAYILANVIAACVTPFFRRRFGRRAFSGYPMAAVLMFFYAGFADCPLLAWYLIPWLVMVAWHRITASASVYSRHQGYPWIFGWTGNDTVARFGEVGICYLMATQLGEFSEGLSVFLQAVCVALLIVWWTESSVIRERAIAKGDAEAMARHYNGL